MTGFSVPPQMLRARKMPRSPDPSPCPGKDAPPGSSKPERSPLGLSEAHWVHRSSVLSQGTVFRGKQVS